MKTIPSSFRVLRAIIAITSHCQKISLHDQGVSAVSFLRLFVSHRPLTARAEQTKARAMQAAPGNQGELSLPSRQITVARSAYNPANKSTRKDGRLAARDTEGGEGFSGGGESGETL